MSAAEEAWEEHIAGEPHWFERRYPEIKDGFLAGYRRALEDAADALDEETTELGIKWLRDRAAAADPRETKD